MLSMTETPTRSYGPKPVDRVERGPVNGLDLDKLYRLKALGKALRIPIKLFPGNVIHWIGNERFVVLREALPVLSTPDFAKKLTEHGQTNEFTATKHNPTPELWTTDEVIVSAYRARDLLGMTLKRFRAVIKRHNVETVSLRSMHGNLFVTVASLRGFSRLCGHVPPEPQAETIAAPVTSDSAEPVAVESLDRVESVTMGTEQPAL